MSGKPPSQHFRFNPVELAIFTGITLVLAHQVYSLFYDGHGTATASRLAQLPAVAWDRAGSTLANTSPTAPLFLSYELKCDQNSGQSTGAGKFRLTGTICGAPLAANGDSDSGRKPASTVNLVGVQVTNVANKFTATVFTDGVAGKFSTDYIPLNAGKNLVRVEFHYSDQHTVTKDFTVDKSDK